MESHAFFVEQVYAECGDPLSATSAKVFGGWTAMSQGGACGDTEKAVLAELAEKCCKIESIEQFSKLNRTVSSSAPAADKNRPVHNLVPLISMCADLGAVGQLVVLPTGGGVGVRQTGPLRRAGSHGVSGTRT